MTWPYRLFWILCVSLVCLACSRQDDTMPTTRTDVPDEQMDSVRIVSQAGQRLEYTLEAVHIDHWKERRMMAADTVTVQTYNAEGVLQATLRADHAELDEAEDILTARHHVVIVNSQGDSLLTEYVVWNRATDIIESDQPITVIRQDGVFRGNGVRTNIEFSDIVSSGISGEGTTPDSLEKSL